MKKRTTKLIFIAACLILSVSVLFGGSLAWLVLVRDSMVLVAGDMEIEVLSARYAFARTQIVDETEVEELISDESGTAFHPLTKNALNTVPATSDNTYVLYEFVIKNRSKTDAELALRFSDFSSYLFKGMTAYDAACAETDESARETAKEVALKLPPYKNFTAKNIFKFRYLKYSYDAVTVAEDSGSASVTWKEDIAGAEMNWTDAEQYDADAATQLWHFAHGRYVFGAEENSLYKYIQLKGEFSSLPETVGDTVTIRIALASNFDQSSMNDYYKWVEKPDEYCWNSCKALLGVTDTSKDDVIAAYLEGVVEGEKQALADASRAGENQNDGFQLTINYFEFIGENIPWNDSAVKDNDSTSSDSDSDSADSESDSESAGEP